MEWTWIDLLIALVALNGALVVLAIETYSRLPKRVRRYLALWLQRFRKR